MAYLNIHKAYPWPIEKLSVVKEQLINHVQTMDKMIHELSGFRDNGESRKSIVQRIEEARRTMDTVKASQSVEIESVDSKHHWYVELLQKQLSTLTEKYGLKAQNVCDSAKFSSSSSSSYLLTIERSKQWRALRKKIWKS